MTLPKSCRYLVFALTMTSFLLVASNASALTFTIDPAQSSLSLTGMFGGLPLSPQAAGGDVTSYSGTLDVNMDNVVAPNTIKFVGGSAVAAVNGVWLPNDVLDDPGAPGCVPSALNCGGDEPNAIPGDADPGDPAPGNYGLEIFIPGAIFGQPNASATAFAAVRDGVFSLTSGLEPVVAGSFASTQTLTFGSGQFDSNLSSTIIGLDDGAGSDSLAGDTGDNGAANGTYSVVGNVITLTVPLDLTLGTGVTLQYAGQLVATAQVPEPSSLLLLVLGSLALAGVVSRRHR